MKNTIHTVYLKHDSQFKTLSKIALAQLILKIIFSESKNGCTLKTIESILQNITKQNIPNKQIEDAIIHLKRESKVNAKSNKYFIHEKYKPEIEKAVNQYETLHVLILKKYFEKSDVKTDIVRNWFETTIIKFFERFSYEWFHYEVTKKKPRPNLNLDDILDEISLNFRQINRDDIIWLNSQFKKFIESTTYDDNKLLWSYGVTMFSSRLITASNYSDKLTLDTFKNATFIIDTNILMILQLEAHDLAKSFEELEKIFNFLTINTCYFYITRDEYSRAIEWKKKETLRIFNEYEFDVLKKSDCPYIQTGIKRECKTEDDFIRFFDTLLDIPDLFYSDLKLKLEDNVIINEAILNGEADVDLQNKIDQIKFQRTKQHKRERAKIHDVGLIYGANKLRENRKCWILTKDSILKQYADDNLKRNETAIAIGLDVLINMLAIQNGSSNVDAENFAPLFANLVRYSLVPENEAFEIEDLSFILSTNIQINQLPNETIIEIAKEVRRMRVSGKTDEEISLYLRRQFEKEKFTLGNEKESAELEAKYHQEKSIQVEKKNQEYKEYIRKQEEDKLLNELEKKLLLNRVLFFLVIPFVIFAITFLIWKYLSESDNLIVLLCGLGVEISGSILTSNYLINPKLIKKYKDITKIKEQVNIKMNELNL
jgi:hypothetical protein